MISGQLLFARLLVGGATSGLLTHVLPAAAQPAAASWMTFQVDHQLALQLPALPRQQATGKADQVAQTYLAQSAHAVWFLTRVDAPVSSTPVALDVIYTSVTQKALTKLGAERVHQAPFRVGALEGLTVDFRRPATATAPELTGTLWVLQVQHTLYLAQWWPKESAQPTNAAEQHQFAASWTLTSLPTTAPTAAQLTPFHRGQFRDVHPPGPSTLLVRTDSTQLEENAAQGIRVAYSLKWTPMGYELRQRSSTSPYAALMQDKVIKVRITAVQGDTYWYWATIDEFISTGQIQRVK